MFNNSRLVKNGGESGYFNTTAVPAALQKENGPWTMAVWFKPLAMVTGTIFSVGPTSGSGYVALAMTAEGKAFLECNGHDSFSTAKATEGTWHHFAGTSTEATTGGRHVWLDGVIGEASDSGGLTLSSPNLMIGALQLSTGIVSRSRGLVSHVVAWNAVLTEQELQSLAAGLHPFAVRPSAMILYVPMYNPVTGGSPVGTPELDLISGTSLPYTNYPAETEFAEGPPHIFLPDPPFFGSPKVGGGGGQALTLSLTDAVAPAESRGKADRMKRVDALASVSEARSKAPKLKRADSQALADAVRRSVRESRKDNVALAETIKRALGHKGVDSQVVADALHRGLGIHKADALVITEALRRRAGVAKKDAIAPTEKHQNRVGKGLKDSSTPTDALRRAGAIRRADGLVLGELLAHAWFARRKLAETIPLSDDFLVFLGQALEFSETTALQDHLIRVWAAHSHLADTLAPSEARKLQAALRRADTASVVEHVRKAAGVHQKAAFGLSDVRRLAAGKGLAESVGLTDAVKLIPHHVLGTGDPVVFHDALARAWAAHLAEHDAFALTDVARRAAGKHLKETVGLGDARHQSWKALRGAADAFSLVDAVEAFSSKGSNPRDSVHVADALERAWHAVFKRAEALSTADSHHLGFAKFARDGVHVPDAHLRSLAKHQAAALVFTDHLQRAISTRHLETAAFSSRNIIRLQKRVGELTFVEDARSSGYHKAFTEAAAATDHILRGLGFAKRDQIAVSERRRPTLGRPLHDGFGLGDALKQSHALRFRDSVMPLDYRSRSLGLGRHETMALQDAVDVLRVLGVFIDEALEIADGLRRDQIKALHDLAELEDHAGIHARAAHLALLALADYLQTQTSLEDAAKVLGELADRAATTLQVEDGAA